MNEKTPTFETKKLPPTNEAGKEQRDKQIINTISDSQEMKTVIESWRRGTGAESKLFQILCNETSKIKVNKPLLDALNKDIPKGLWLKTITEENFSQIVDYLVATFMISLNRHLSPLDKRSGIARSDTLNLNNGDVENLEKSQFGDDFYRSILEPLTQNRDSDFGSIRSAVISAQLSGWHTARQVLEKRPVITE